MFAIIYYSIKNIDDIRVNTRAVNVKILNAEYVALKVIQNLCPISVHFSIRNNM